MSASKLSLSTVGSNKIGMGCCAQDHYMPVSCPCASGVTMFSDSVYNMVKRVSLTKPARYLTAQQRKRVERTWSQLSDEMSLLGLDCMTTLWLQCPAVPAVFQLPANYSKELHRNPRFHQHACWMVQAVSAAVENADSMDKLLEDTFVEIGVKHAAVPQFPVHTFAALPRVWATVWESHLSGRFTGQTEKSWAKLFLFISDSLKDGYDQCTLIDDLNDRSTRRCVTFGESQSSVPALSRSSVSRTICTPVISIPTEHACPEPCSVVSSVEELEGPDVIEHGSHFTFHTISPGGRKLSRAKQRRRLRSRGNVDDIDDDDASSIVSKESTAKKNSVVSTLSFMKSRKVSACPSSASK